MNRQEINDRTLKGDAPSEGLGRRAAGGGAIAAIAQGVRIVLQIASVALLARLLAPEDFGLVAMAGAVTALVGVLTELNMSSAAIQRKDLDQDSVSGMFWFGIGMSFAALALSAAFIPVANWLFHDDRVGLIVLWMSFTAPIYALGSMHQALLTRNMRWFDLQLTSLGSFAIGIAAALLSAWLLDVGYWALVIQGWATAASSSALAWARCPWRPTWVRDWSRARSSLSFGINLSASMILNYLNRQIDNILIGWRWGSVPLGYYARAYSVLQTPLSFLSGPLGSALVPAMSRLQHDPKAWSRAYLEALGAITFISGAIACLLFGGAEAIIRVVLGRGWDESTAIFLSLAPTLFVAGPMRSTGWIYLSLGRTDRMLQWGLVATPVYIGSFFAGLPFGPQGVALAFSIAQVAAFVPCMWMAVRDTPVSLPAVFAVALPPMLVSVLIAAALYATSTGQSLLVQILALAGAGLAYSATAVVMTLSLPQYSGLRTRAAEFLSGLSGNAADRIVG